MKKILNTAMILLAAGCTLAASVSAQQTDATKPATSSSSASTTKAAHKAATAKKPTPLELKTAKDKASYAIGMSIGGSLKRDSIDIDTVILLQGMKDVLAGEKPLLTEEDARTAITTLQKEAKEKQEAKMKALGEENKKEGDAFLEANKSKEGVIALPSGLQYKVEKQGDGPKPTLSDTVECNYRGTLLNGKEFDSSAKHGKPASFTVGGVIKGWTEVLQLMPVGSKYQVYIPADLAYGSSAPRGSDITPNSTLIFDIELLSIKEKPASSAAPAVAPDAPKAQTMGSKVEAAKPADAPKPPEPAK